MELKIESDNRNLFAGSSIRLVQQLYAHDTLNVVTPLEALEQDHVLMTAPDAVLGKFVTCGLNGANRSSLAWKGVVASVGSSTNYGGVSTLRIVASGPTMFLQNGTTYRSFAEASDLDSVVSTVLKSYPRNIVKRAGSCARHKLPCCVQYAESDLDLLLRLCSQYGEWFYWTGSMLHVGKLSGDPLQLIVGQDLFNVESSLRIHPMGTELLRRDYAGDQKETVDFTESISNKPDGFEAVAFGQARSMQHAKPKKVPRVLAVDKAHLEELAGIRRAVEKKDLVTFTGQSRNAQIMVGKKISLRMLRSTKKDESAHIPFGEYIVIRVVHEVNRQQEYQNYFEAIPAGVPLPPLNPSRSRPHASLETAVVTKNDDSTGMSRVKVRFLWQEKDQMSPWVRVALPYAGADYGVHFIPEVGDEVLVGFEQGNPEKPVVLGGLFHGKATAKSWKDGKNAKKGFRTKGGNEILFSDEDGKITIKAKRLEIDGGDEVKISVKVIKLN